MITVISPYQRLILQWCLKCYKWGATCTTSACKHNVTVFWHPQLVDTRVVFALCFRSPVTCRLFMECLFLVLAFIVTCLIHSWHTCFTTFAQSVRSLGALARYCSENGGCQNRETSPDGLTRYSQLVTYTSRDGHATQKFPDVYLYSSGSAGKTDTARGLMAERPWRLWRKQWVSACVLRNVSGSFSLLGL